MVRDETESYSDDSMQFSAMTMNMFFPNTDDPGDDNRIIDMDFIVDTCLDQVKWRQGDRWVALKQGTSIMVQAVSEDLATQLRLVWEVLNESLSSFSLEKLLNSPTPNPPGMAAA